MYISKTSLKKYKKTKQNKQNYDDNIGSDLVSCHKSPNLKL